jgi:hypothetical protein
LAASIARRVSSSVPLGTVATALPLFESMTSIVLVFLFEDRVHFPLM